MTSALTPEELAKHITIWNRIERRKIAGNAAPLRRNLAKYLLLHPECEEFRGQDKDPNLRPGSIDPVTGERIAIHNEHVPIWHRVERRKVTGNAAPLRKNLEAYLRKYPHCEVYNGQDKVPRWGPQAQSHTIAVSNVNDNNIHENHHQSTAHESLSAASHQMHHHTHQPVRRWVYAPGRVPAWGPPHGPVGQGGSHASVHQTNNNQAHTGNAAELSYVEMASSWSNNPEWVNQGGPHTPMTPTTMNGLPGLLPHSFSSNYGMMCPMDIGDTSINGIPIPGGVARDRPDISMGTSFGAGTTPLDGAGILGETPRSMDGDPDAMQFSPSHYLLGSLPGRSPPPVRMSQPLFKPAPLHGSQN